jgi:hypothetical protein
LVGRPFIPARGGYDPGWRRLWRTPEAPSPRAGERVRWGTRAARTANRLARRRWRPIGRRALTISIALIVLYVIVGELLLFGDEIGIFDD